MGGLAVKVVPTIKISQKLPLALVVSAAVVARYEAARG